MTGKTIKSVYEDQSDILSAIIELYSPDGFDADISYGNGAFYKKIPEPRIKIDICPQVDGVVQASSDSLPIPDSSLSSIVFDPPFLTYVRQNREGNGSMIMARRFSGYWRYDELEAHYKGTLSEAGRVLKKRGIMVFKCQDIIHNHRMHCTHANVIRWAEDAGLRIKDLFILPAKHRLPAPNRKGRQRHARVFHSYFIVLERV